MVVGLGWYGASPLFKNGLDVEFYILEGVV